jgi:hypothetical protein
MGQMSSHCSLRLFSGLQMLPHNSGSGWWPFAIKAAALVLLPLGLWLIVGSNYAPPTPAQKPANQQNARKPNELYDGKLLDYRDLLLPNTSIGSVDDAGLTSLLHSLHRVCLDGV